MEKNQIEPTGTFQARWRCCYLAACRSHWSIIFFGLHNPGGALIEIVLLWMMITATMVAFARVSKPAAWLLVPYLAWISFAAYLNYALWILN